MRKKVTGHGIAKHEQRNEQGTSNRGKASGRAGGLNSGPHRGLTYGLPKILYEARGLPQNMLGRGMGQTQDFSQKFGQPISPAPAGA